MNIKYKQGQDRIQPLLFPPSIDDYVSEDNPVRVIESYVDILDLKELGFEDTRKSNSNNGQKAYSPSLLLKIYIYGYINKIRSSRMLERECKRNIELIWLTSNLTPSYHTIALNFKNK
ncbi:MAG: transposase [Campylobacterota bacterium]|nr:transposase [Campylobacterota bacterium]